MQERDVERYLVDQVRAAGGRAYKFTSPGNAGVPDRLILLPGATIAFAEVKAPGQKPRPLQVHAHDDIRRLGLRVYVPDSREAVDQMLRELLKGGDAQ